MRDALRSRGFGIPAVLITKGQQFTPAETPVFRSREGVFEPIVI